MNHTNYQVLKLSYYTESQKLCFFLIGGLCAEFIPWLRGRTSWSLQVAWPHSITLFLKCLNVAQLNLSPQTTYESNQLLSYCSNDFIKPPFLSKGCLIKYIINKTCENEGFFCFFLKKLFFFAFYHVSCLFYFLCFSTFRKINQPQMRF